MQQLFKNSREKKFQNKLLQSGELFRNIGFLENLHKSQISFNVHWSPFQNFGALGTGYRENLGTGYGKAVPKISNFQIYYIIINIYKNSLFPLYFHFTILIDLKLKFKIVNKDFFIN